MCTVGNVVCKQMNKYFQAKQNNSEEPQQCVNMVRVAMYYCCMYMHAAGSADDYGEAMAIEYNR